MDETPRPKTLPPGTMRIAFIITLFLSAAVALMHLEHLMAWILAIFVVVNLGFPFLQKLITRK
jgi:hypothetical protein